MIGALRGEVVAHLPTGAVVVDVGGVGYEVQLAAPAPPEVGEEVDIAIYTVVRDDQILLYGFADFEERGVFTQLLATPGVGPSTALAALRTMTATALRAAIEAGDDRLVASIPGIGPKTAARIVLELRGKLAESPVASVPPAVAEALRHLGYASSEVRELGTLTWPVDESQALRLALRTLGHR